MLALGIGRVSEKGMTPAKSVIRAQRARTKQLERMVKGFANHRRIEILELLAGRPDLCVGEISEKLEIEMKTASEHLRRLVLAGLVLKRYDSRKVRHALTDRARDVLKFLARLN
jgi:DNA-binding transcriptional ArsR family regulator